MHMLVLISSTRNIWPTRSSLEIISSCGRTRTSPSFQKLFELPPVSSNTAGVGLRNEVQFLVGVYGWLDVPGFAQKRERHGEHSRLFSIGDDGFHAIARLGWIRRVGDDDPIAMAVERQPVFKDLFPFCAHFEISSSSEQTATLPHFPEAIRA